MKYSTYILVILTLWGATLSFANAQSSVLPPEATPTIYIDSIPKHPRPGQSVTLKAVNYSMDLQGASISWYVNGKLIKKGTGATQIEIIADTSGKATTLLAIATGTDGKTIRGTLTLRPSIIDLVWEADSYVPPFYKSKALFPHQGSARVIAMPFLSKDGKTFIDAKNLIYKWSVNDKVRADASGFGKNVFSYNGSVLLQSDQINVEVSSTDGSIVSTGSIALKPIDSGILMYEDNPLYGIRFEKALGDSYSGNAEELHIAAIPYFFQASSRNNGNLSYGWTLNSAALPQFAKQGTITIRQPGASGVSTLSLEIKDVAKAFQTSRRDLNIISGKNDSDLFSQESQI